MHGKKEPVLSLATVTKQYDSKSRGITDITLDVRPGEVFGFLGPNGAGKSTTINVILDLLRPSKGTIFILGHDHRDHPAEIRKQIGFLSGDMTTDTTLTGNQYLKFVANLHGNVPWARVEKLITRLKCQVDKKIKHLSRGNRQKIGLIAALMHDPDLLILDEPTSGLDPLIQAEFNEIIREHKARGKTTFISSHVLSEVQAICDQVGFIRDGHLVRVSPLDELIREATKRVIVVFDSPIPKKGLANLAGSHNLKIDGEIASFHFKGDDNELLSLLAKYAVKDVQISEPDLTDLFMGYYKSNEGAEDV